MSQMRLHISEPRDTVAQVAFGRACAVGEFVGGEATKEDLGVVHGRVGFTLLRDEEVAELAEDELAGAGCCAVGCEGWKGGEGFRAGRAD